MQEKEMIQLDESTVDAVRQMMLYRILHTDRKLWSERDKIMVLQHQGINPYAPHNLLNFAAVRKVKSVFRAIRRGTVGVEGDLFPKRPFNNRTPSRGRKQNELKKKIYGEYQRIARRYNDVAI